MTGHFRLLHQHLVWCFHHRRKAAALDLPGRKTMPHARSPVRAKEARPGHKSAFSRHGRVLPCAHARHFPGCPFSTGRRSRLAFGVLKAATRNRFAGLNPSLHRGERDSCRGRYVSHRYSRRPLARLDDGIYGGLENSVETVWNRARLGHSDTLSCGSWRSSWRAAVPPISGLADSA